MPPAISTARPAGGTYVDGTVFELSPTGGGGWTETVLHSFGNGTDGSYPYGSLIFDAAGNLYGTTSRAALTAPAVRNGVRVDAHGAEAGRRRCCIASATARTATPDTLGRNADAGPLIPTIRISAAKPLRPTGVLPCRLFFGRRGSTFPTWQLGWALVPRESRVPDERYAPGSGSSGIDANLG